MSDDFFSDDYEDDLNEEPAPRGNGLRQFAESQKQRADALAARAPEKAVSAGTLEPRCNRFSS